MFEIEAEIKDFPDYTISTWGQVRSLKFGKTRVLKPRKDKLGYFRVELCKDGKKKPLLVHRLVANAFIPNPQGYPFINHRDENPSNNFVTNLEFCSPKYNSNYGTCRQKISAKLKGKFNGPCAKPVNQYDQQGNFLKRWPSTQEIKRQLRFNQGNISQCCLGERQSANGFVWKYA